MARNNCDSKPQCRKKSPCPKFHPRLEILESRLLLNAGDLDPTFGSGGIVMTSLQGLDRAHSLALQADGKIVAGGFSANSSGNSAELALVRYNPDGTLDTSFGTGGKVLMNAGSGASFDATSIVIQPDGRIDVGDDIGHVIRFLANGTLDTTFGQSGIANAIGNNVTNLLLQPDGKILVAGATGGQATFDTVVRLNPDGSADKSFQTISISATYPGMDGTPRLGLEPDGSIAVLVGLDAGSGILGRYNPDGSADFIFGSAGRIFVSTPDFQPVTALALQADSRILTAGTAMEGPNDFDAFLLSRFTINFGNPDVTLGGTGQVANPAINPQSTASPVNLLLQPDDRILATGNIKFINTSTPSTFALVRYNPNGSTDTSFGTNGLAEFAAPLGDNSSAGAAVLQPDGKIVVAGTVHDPSTGSDKFLVVRYLGDTVSGTSNQRFVAQVYLDLLQRPADATGLAGWSGLLDSGQATRAQIAQAIENSPEYHNLIIETYYGQYLKRPADSFGLSAWGSFLAQGGLTDQLRAALLGSDEYFQNVGGGANPGFLTSLYRDVLGRPGDAPGLQAWSQDLTEGVSRTAVASAIIRSAEGNADEVQGVYGWLLHRPADQGGLQAFSTDLANGVPIEAIIAAIIGSQEYSANRVG
jgi:uncharacterized delta-60 repeat protein